MPLLSTLSRAAFAFPGDVAGLPLSAAVWSAPAGVVGDGGESDRLPAWSCSRSAWMTPAAG